MAASGSTSRAIYAGLSCGFVFAVPVAAYVATMPFSDANGTVTACALPFTVGALAGVGILSAVSAVGRRHERAEDGDAASAPGFSAASSTQDYDDVERFFGSRRVPKDVPVIARAQDALSEEEAWADIDSMLSEDSPISCDAANSKDIYQIALEELQRETRSAAQGAQAAPAAGTSAAWGDAAYQQAAPASYAAPAGSAPALGTTAMYIALAQGVAAQAAAAPAYASSAAASSYAASTAAAGPAAPAAAASYAAYGAATSAQAADEAPVAAPSTQGADATVMMRAQEEPAASTAQVAASDDLDTDAAQRAALASLDEIDGARLKPSIPVMHASDAPMPVSASAAQQVASEQVRPASAEPADRPAARYAGREDIWASALDILAEGAPAAQPDAEPSYVGRHMRTAATTARAAAVAEGHRATAMHEHVNNLIEEELGQVPSSSVRRSSREYLRVIQGGTASMPPLKAEA